MTAACARRAGCMDALLQPAIARMARCPGWPLHQGHECICVVAAAGQVGAPGESRAGALLGDRVPGGRRQQLIRQCIHAAVPRRPDSLTGLARRGPGACPGRCNCHGPATLACCEGARRRRTHMRPQAACTCLHHDGPMPAARPSLTRRLPSPLLPAGLARPLAPLQMWSRCGSSWSATGWWRDPSPPAWYVMPPARAGCVPSSSTHTHAVRRALDCRDDLQQMAGNTLQRGARPSRACVAPWPRALRPSRVIPIVRIATQSFQLSSQTLPPARTRHLTHPPPAPLPPPPPFGCPRSAPA